MNGLLLHGIRLGAAWLIRGGHKSVANAVSGAASGVRGLWNGDTLPIVDWCEQAGWPTEWSGERTLWILVDGGPQGVSVMRPPGGPVVYFTAPASLRSTPRDAGEPCEVRLSNELKRRNARLTIAQWRATDVYGDGHVYFMLEAEQASAGMTGHSFRAICRNLAEEAASVNAFVRRTWPDLPTAK